MLCALIMAGGKGTRFWPLSTEEKPKQFLSLIGKDTMIQMTVKRIQELIPLERIFVVTGKKYISLVKEQLPQLPEENIIVEPYGKNTAPCIALSAFYINKKIKDATITVLPADHLIIDEKKYREVLKSADEFVDKNKQAIVTIGIKPNRAETGYGYMSFNSTYRTINGNEIKEVNRFIEKPDKERARKYFEEGNYLWNAGMFVWKADNILRLTHTHLENTFNALSEIAAAKEEDYQKILEERYSYVDSISVDYGIMEKAESVYVIPSDFGWDDVGSWSALERYIEKDDNGNVCIGNVKNIDGKNNMVVSNGKSIVINGLNNVYVVENDGIIIICEKSKVDKIKEMKSKVV